MGKGDKRSKRGKIYRGTFGKSRSRKQKNVIATREAQSQNRHNSNN